MERNTDEHRGPRIGSTNQLIITWLLYKRPRNLMKAAGPLVERLISLRDFNKIEARDYALRVPLRLPAGTKIRVSAPPGASLNLLCN